MLSAFSCPERELSCIIGNLFIELEPPCSECGKEPRGIKLCGTTYTGDKAVLTISGDRFYYSGPQADIDRLREAGGVQWLNHNRNF